MKHIQAHGKGVVVFINKSRQGGGLADELKAYAAKKLSSQEHGGTKLDSKDRGIGAQILRDVGVTNIALLSNT